MNRRVVYLSVLLAVPLVGVAGCSNNDRNKQVEEAQKTEVEAAREQRVQSIDQAKENQVEAIEKRTDQVQEQAKQLPDQTEQRAKAQADMMSTRETFSAQARARLQKADARIEETRNKLKIAGGRAPLAAHDKVDQAARDRAEVAAGVDRLRGVSNDRWGDAKKRVEKQLDELDALVDDAASQADKALP